MLSSQIVADYVMPLHRMLNISENGGHQLDEWRYVMGYNEYERTVGVHNKLKIVLAHEPTRYTSPPPTPFSSQFSHTSYLATALRNQFQF